MLTCLWRDATARCLPASPTARCLAAAGVSLLPPPAIVGKVVTTRWHQWSTIGRRFAHSRAEITVTAETMAISARSHSILATIASHARKQPHATAIVQTQHAQARSCRRWTYAELWRDIRAYQRVVASALGTRDSTSPTGGMRPTIALMMPNSYAFVVSLLGGVWANGCVAVPLSPTHPPAEIDYMLSDSRASHVLVAEELREKLPRNFTSSVVQVPGFAADVTSGDEEVKGATIDGDKYVEDTATLDVCSQSLDDAALIIYTSGTTSRPKGVVHTHRSLSATLSSMHVAWARSPHDGHLGVLPLYHVHGLVNIVLGSLHCGGWLWFPGGDTVASAELKRPLWEWRSFWDGALPMVAAQDRDPDRARNLAVMAVPTHYAKWLRDFVQLPSTEQQRVRDQMARATRVWISGSAALLDPVFHGWRDVVGGGDAAKWTILERMGMTEVGMALSNPLQGERVAGTVGIPMPGVEVLLVDETSLQPLASDSTDPGELWISGDTVFREYLGKEQATREAFSEDATGRQWFRTGDVAQRVRVPGRGERDGKGEWYYRILGRQSSDIIKTGGYKVSALEIERELLQHPAVVEVAVVGVPDSDDAQANNTGIWGERIAAIVVEAEPISHAIHAPSTTVTTTTTLRDWLRPRLASYKIPSYVYHMRALPRNHMGKLNKKQLVQMLKDGMIK